MQNHHQVVTAYPVHVGIGVRDDEKRTLLHLISGCLPEEDIREMINLLIQRSASLYVVM